MLIVRGFIDAQRVSAVLLQHGAANCTGVRPGEEVVVSDQTALDWLDANVSTRSRDAMNQAGEQRLRLPDDAVGTGRGGDGHRHFASPEQLTAWVLLWADRRLELRWLGKEVGFGVFATTLIPVGAQIKPIHLRGVADYEFLDPLAMIQAYPTKSDRDAKNCSRDTVTVYGPVALINAACAEHANVSLTDEDLGVGSKKFSVELRATIEARQQVLAAYSPPKGQKWECPFRKRMNAVKHAASRPSGPSGRWVWETLRSLITLGVKNGSLGLARVVVGVVVVYSRNRIRSFYSMRYKGKIELIIAQHRSCQSAQPQTGARRWADKARAQGRSDEPVS
eukprot:scaffold55240_cov58-Phaeocystis_antarctica.AAC.3